MTAKSPIFKAICEAHRPGPGARMAARLGGQVPVLDTRRLQLRAPRIYDFDAFADILCSERAAYMGGPTSRAEAWGAFTGYTALWLLHGHGMWTIDAQSRPSAGFVALGYEYEDPEAELGVFLSADIEGQGIAQEALTAVQGFVFETLGWSSVVSYVDPANDRCIRLMERVSASRDPAAEDGLGGTLVYRHVKGAAA